MKKFCWLSLLVLSSLGNGLFAQFQGPVYKPDTSVKVYAYGSEKTLAWCGGFNNPQVQMADLNKDGLEDMVVFEPYLGVRTFINTGKAGAPVYVYAPEYAVNFPLIDGYMILKDYNCDGIADLFQQGGTGFAASTGYYNSKNQLCFKYYKNLYYNNDANVTGWVNAYNNPSDIPAIVDIDNDGDLDFLSYNVIGGNINCYKNMAVERGYPCDSIIIELKDRCWAHVYQAYWRTHILNYNCDETGIGPWSGGFKVTHQGNTLCLFDYDGDGDYDYLDGSISFNEMTFLLNGRIPNNPTGRDSMVSQDTNWQSNGKRIELPLWPAAFNIDVDQDGKKDLVISPNAANTSENYKCIWYYKNESTPGHPSYVFQTDTLMIDKSIDMGTGAYPTLFDYNKDGKPDLIVGSDGYYQSSGSLKSRLSYYMNTSTPGHPSFTLQSTDFLNISINDFQGAAPAIGDITNDGKQDLVLGHSDGTLSLFTNTAATNNVQPNWQLSAQQQTLKDVNNNIITVGGYAAPLIYDLNQDGKPDLIIGSQNGRLTYYKNVSTITGVVSLQFVTNNLGNARSDPKENFGGSSTPFIGPMDSTGKIYLLMGSNSGNLYRYDGFQDGNVTTPYTMIDSQYSYIDSAYQAYGTTYGEYGNMRSAPVVGDIDGDGKYEMFVGLIQGGIQLYQEGIIERTGITNISSPNNTVIQVYPNPAKDNITISLSNSLKEDALVSIVNIEGQQLITTTAAAGQTKINIPLPNLPSGMYVCVVQVNTNKYYNKFTILK